MACVYLLRCLPTGREYVGISKGLPERRFKEHCHAARKGSDSRLHRAIRKYGRQAFSVEVLASALSWLDATEKEQELIALRGTMAPVGYNMTKGGEGTIGYRHTVDARARMSAKHTGKILSPETRQRLSEAKKGIPKPEGFGAKVSAANQSRVLPEETKERLRAHLREIVSRPEVKAAIAAANRSRILTHEERHRLATMNLGRKHRAEEIEKIARANSRRVWTPEMRERMSIALRKALARPEVKAKMAASNSRRVWTPEMRARMSVAQTGKPKPRRVKEDRERQPPDRHTGPDKGPVDLEQ